MCLKSKSKLLNLITLLSILSIFFPFYLLISKIYYRLQAIFVKMVFHVPNHVSLLYAGLTSDGRRIKNIARSYWDLSCKVIMNLKKSYKVMGSCFLLLEKGFWIRIMVANFSIGAEEYFIGYLNLQKGLYFFF